jgi:hypothetical protein
LHFYLDNDIPVDIKDHLRNRGHGATTTRDLGLWRAKDAQQVLVADENGWTLVTHNAADFVLLHEAWLLWTTAWESARRHSGILIIPQNRWLPDEAARNIHHLVAEEISLANALYRWWPKSGWLRHVVD